MHTTVNEILESVATECLGRSWREMAESYIYALRHPRVKIHSTLDAQIFYVQKKIRGHVEELVKIRNCVSSYADPKILLERLGLRSDLISPSTIWICLNDLEIERQEEIERQFGDYLLTLAFPNIAKNDVNAIDIDKQAAEIGLALVEPNKERGQYVGPLVATDNHFGLIKYAQGQAVKLLFWDLAEGPDWPQRGDMVRMAFKDGKLVVSVAKLYSTKL